MFKILKVIYQYISSRSPDTRIKVKNQQKDEKRSQAEANNSGTSVKDTPDGKLYIQIIKEGCPDCGSKKFAIGPSGGISTNIECECGSKFNMTPVVQIAQRI